MTARRAQRCRRQRDRGVALVIVLVFLAILTLLGLAALQGATLGLRFAIGAQDRSLALQAAEMALRDAERDIAAMRADGTPCIPGSPGCRPAIDRQGGVLAGLSSFDAQCTRGQCLPADATTGATTDAATAASPVWEQEMLWANAVPYGRYTHAAPLEGVAAQPEYLIEALDEYGDRFVFRVTARGHGATRAAVTMLQTIVVTGDPSEQEGER